MTHPSFDRMAAPRWIGAAASVAAIALAGAVGCGESSPNRARGPDQHQAVLRREAQSPPVEAAFPSESYRAGQIAPLRIWARSPAEGSLRIVLAGRTTPSAQNPFGAVPVTRWRDVAIRQGLRVPVAIGAWPSGLYSAELRTHGRSTFAPFVIAPDLRHASAVAIVLPTRTWQAYNMRDDDGDGRTDSWQARGDTDTVRLGRPFGDHGVPPHLSTDDLPFLRWIFRTGRAADVLAQEDLDGTTGAQLANAYDLLVFPGHHEYVTEDEYDAVEGFRNRGGNLMFLSAKNFFWKVDVRHGVMARIREWRALGRPEAALVGTQYIGKESGSRGPWMVRAGSRPKWLFSGIKLGQQGQFSSGGIEADAVSASSPPETNVVATIPNLLGRGKSADMTYYEAPSGAKVFAAGAFTLAGAVRQIPVRRLLNHLWRRLGRTLETPNGLRSGRRSLLCPLAPPGALRGLVSKLKQYPTLRLATPFERSEARRLLAATQRASRAWRDPRAAARAGFNTRRSARAVGETRMMWLHSESRAFHNDDAYVDPTRPDTLIYADAPGRPLSLVGVMFSVPRGVEGANFGGPITRWHWHVVCSDGVRRGTKPLPGDTCPAGTRLYGGSEMLHIWFTSDLRSAFAIHAPVPELCRAGLVPPDGCAGNRVRGM